MPIPLSVRRISHALQQNVLEHLDLSDLSPERATHDRSEVLSRGLAAVALANEVQCSLEEAAAAVVDGSRDGGMDAIYTTAHPPRLFIVQAKWSQRGEATLDQPATASLDTGIQKLTNRDRTFLNSRILAKWHSIQDALDNPHCKIIVIIALLGSKPVHESQDEELRNIARRHHSLDDFDFLYRYIDVFQEQAKTGFTGTTLNLKVDLLESFHREKIGKSPEAYQGSIRARSVYEWYKEHGERLFEKNLRGRLEDTSINGEIGNTLHKDPDQFWHLNKGIMLVANDITSAVGRAENKGQGPRSVELEQASIIDGAQTVSTTYKILSGLKHSSAPAWDANIPIRIVSLKGMPAELANRITKAANTQNAILPQDYAAIDPVQEKIQFELDTIGKRYIYKRGGDTEITDSITCRIEEVVRALVCHQRDSRLVARINGNPHSAWERQGGGIYQTVFGTAPDARLIWNSVIFLRRIRTKMDIVATQRSGRTLSVAENSTLLISHILINLIDDTAIKNALDSDWEDEIIRSERRCDEILDRIIHHTEEQFGNDASARSVFSGESSTKLIADLVFEDLRSNATRPTLSATQRQRTRSANAATVIIDNELIPEGTPLLFKSHTISRRQQVDAWRAENPERGKAIWTNNRRQPLRQDGRAYSPSTLAQDLIEEITGHRPKSVRGPDCWVTADGRSLTDLAEEAKRRAADG